MKYIFFLLPLCLTQPVSASMISLNADHFRIDQPFTSGRGAFDLNRNAFYKAMESDNEKLVDAQILELASGTSIAETAFLGAITMKRAGIGGNPFIKLQRFKKGHGLLEAAINQDPQNVEFRFLRLMIQENAPGLLGYAVDEEEDSDLIRKSYKSLPADLQKTIAAYNKVSKVLKLVTSS